MSNTVWNNRKYSNNLVLQEDSDDDINITELDDTTVKSTILQKPPLIKVSTTLKPMMHSGHVFAWNPPHSSSGTLAAFTDNTYNSRLTGEQSKVHEDEQGNRYRIVGPPKPDPDGDYRNMDKGNRLDQKQGGSSTWRSKQTVVSEAPKLDRSNNLNTQRERYIQQNFVMPVTTTDDLKPCEKLFDAPADKHARVLPIVVDTDRGIAEGHRHNYHSGLNLETHQNKIYRLPTQQDNTTMHQVEGNEAAPLLSRATVNHRSDAFEASAPRAYRGVVSGKHKQKLKQVSFIPTTSRGVSESASTAPADNVSGLGSIKQAKVTSFGSDGVRNRRTNANVVGPQQPGVVSKVNIGVEDNAHPSYKSLGQSHVQKFGEKPKHRASTKKELLQSLGRAVYLLDTSVDSEFRRKKQNTMKHLKPLPSKPNKKIIHSSLHPTRTDSRNVKRAGMFEGVSLSGDPSQQQTTHMKSDSQFRNEMAFGFVESTRRAATGLQNEKREVVVG